MKPIKPTFLIIGSAKCGTTALASVLGAHPDCCVSNPKEVSFFQDTIDHKENPNYLKGWKWYKEAFYHYSGESVLGEATPSYSDRSRSPDTARRIHAFNPNMKIIYMVRDPLERQISAWRMQYAHGLENAHPGRREVEWALKGINYWMQQQHAIKQWDECLYNHQLEAYRDYFPESQILVTFLEDWRTSKESEISRVMRFLGLDPVNYNFAFSEEANVGHSRTIERPFLRKLRTTDSIKRIIRVFPATWRDWARMHVARRVPAVPAPDLSNTLRSQFLEYVETDAKRFLSCYSKPIHLWKSIEGSVTQR